MYDLANYLNEFCCDNNYPSGSGIAHFLQNSPSDDEIVAFTRHYHQLETKSADVSIEDNSLHEKVLAVKQCMILNLYYWATWSIVTLNEEDETNPDVYNWDLINGKCDLQ